MALRFLFAALAFASATPAWADASTAVPEGSNLALFAIGLAGILIGRRASARKRD